MYFAVKGVPKNLFSSTFAVCFTLVAANSLLPCPVDTNYNNDSNLDPKLKNQQKHLAPYKYSQQPERSQED
ncbi:hypothetical protein CANTEDRAFT_116324 [Yamadazyma tenuis ATCC 10573]|uniref:Uncharacterized protein n=1 Tax=Candida tenuis (strain ATCC 10573 / BCRC 21748 / CBS 615 / JCM 9827 / NBRC 10315 / NRRL Y-1498 / VKM Y-70) TaxID=590646 RepID=G3BD85_CANTC|nr:uncharacterized protein CANTEDRAFT_116324 [Yamadazyma tenuis ATCC 10573]EGV60266.1 hypothetical protein CANTEDRAFT_116324 [Yamadazyma tenuis ATCC 10573]